MSGAPTAAPAAAGPAHHTESGGLEKIVNSHTQWITTPLKVATYAVGIYVGLAYGSTFADTYTPSFNSWANYVMPVIGYTAGKTLGVVAGGLVGYGVAYAVCRTASWAYHALFGNKKSKKSEKSGGN